MQSGYGLFVWVFFYSWLPVPGLWDSGINLLVESTENNESIHLVSITIQGSFFIDQVRYRVHSHI